MGAPKKLEKPVYVTTVLEESQHEALKYIAFKKRVPMAELFREALEKFIETQVVAEERFKHAPKQAHHR